MVRGGGVDGRGLEVETLAVDGAEPISDDLVNRVVDICAAVEDGGPRGLVLRVGGVPATEQWGDLSVSVVTRWERALRRLERLPAAIVAVAERDCGGVALDALLTADHRIVAPPVRLLVPVVSGATWPGMALYRMAQHSSATAVVRAAVLYGTPIEASGALTSHLVDEVTHDVDGALARFVSLSSALAGTEIAIRRQLLTEAATTSFEDSLGAHLAACDRMLRRVGAGVPS